MTTEELWENLKPFMKKVDKIDFLVEKTEKLENQVKETREEVSGLKQEVKETKVEVNELKSKLEEGMTDIKKELHKIHTVDMTAMLHAISNARIEFNKTVNQYMHKIDKL